MIQQQNDFDRKGSLKSLIEFSALCSVKSITVRERKRYNVDEEDSKNAEFYLVIEDDYGFQCSYFRQGLTLEKAQEIAAKIPYGRSIFLNGEVAIRKGNTYFNVKAIKNPDGSDVLLVRLTEDTAEHAGHTEDPTSSPF